MIRFKVEEETFKEATPAPPKVVGSGETEQHRNEEHKEPVYSLIVTVFQVPTNVRGVVRKTGLELLHGGRIECFKCCKRCKFILGYPVALAYLYSIYWGILLGTPKLSFHLVFVTSPELKRLAIAADRSVL